MLKKAAEGVMASPLPCNDNIKFVSDCLCIIVVLCRCHVLKRAAEGVMARLSFLEHHTLQPGGQGQAKPLCLRNPDYAKMRKKIDLTFPDQLDAAKVLNTE